MLELAAQPVLKLSLIATLFEALHDHDILYCHWKSNEHLGASMKGNTDLDVLFDETQKEKLEAILRQLGFKRFDPIRHKQYHGIVDFLALDAASGKVIHLHTHYCLTMGEPYLKGYHLHIEEYALKTRVFDHEFGLYCIQPALELILLFVRESLKLRHRDKFLVYFKSKAQARAYILREYAWLKLRTNDTEIRAALKALFQDHAAILKIVAGEFNTQQLGKLAPIIKKEVRLKRLYSPFRALALRWSREVTIILSRKVALLFNHPILYRRNNPRGGIIIAVIGADGSGKSTVTENLKSTFQEKLDVFKIYFGRGDGRSSWERKLLKSFRSLFPSEKTQKPGRGADPGTVKKPGFIRALYKCIEGFLVALEKRNNMALMQKAKKKRALVICDRYPQNQVMGYNDGPLLHNLLTSGNLLFRTVAKVESKIYLEAEAKHPDIVFKLIADAEVVEKRKPGETSFEKLTAKINGVKRLKFKEPCKVITIDASRPLNEVLCTIKEEIWKVM